ncbi:hypothetical protein HW130_29245 [Streptomyces sp. PKU-EA00015]|uniref:hypothetical protein n=1 Tax=Streptomyces sp. PKU-EA00015 TaxID=2748326 RepID=UPI0015A2E44F|nr:hypothetical protein [Streptomyces sp. PKU-EA00015]NWF30288.1 hypothetical protein [Streptomyces sp. PKU-EA00015]
MSHPQPWDLGGTLSGQPSLYSHALTVGRQQSGQPRHRRLPQKAPQPSRRANRSKNTAARIAAIAARLTNSDADRPAASVLDKQLRRIVWRDHERALEATLRRRFLPSDRMRQLGRWFATHGEHPNAVRFGILLLGMAGTDGDSDVLKLGAFWAFSTEACEALVRSQADPHRALFELARQAEGWARVDAVGRLEGASDPEIREWLIRESCTGDVLDSYFALTAARVGDLAGVLARKALNEETLDGAGRLLEALTDVDGPGPALASYEDAVRALNGYLFHSTARGITLRRLLSLLSINRFLNDSRVSTICRDNHEWRRMRYRFTRLVADPASRKVVLVGLTDEEPSTLRLAAWAAKLMNIPARPALLRRVESEPYDSTVWFLLIDDCPSEDISAVVEAAARLLPLQELRTGPTTELGLGTEYEVDQILDIIVSRLDDHPGHGWELIETALNNRTSRNRRMALQALKGWPTKFVPSTARQILLAAAAREPVPEVTKEMTQEARRL